MGNTFREAKIVEEGLDEKPIIVEEKKTKTDKSSTDDAAHSKPDSNKSRRKTSRKSNGILAKIFGGDILKHRWVIRQGKLLLLIVFYYLLIVSNRYHVEKLSREKTLLEEENKFLNEQDIKAKTTFQESIKISRIKEELKETDIGIIAGAPYVIDVNEKDINNTKQSTNERR